ncbi:MAG: VOC family protein [Steroidobacteraceae bacterium]
MLNGIDHLVVLVANLESAIESYRKQGFAVVPGGRHPTGTHNALIGLADGSYLELLAFHEANTTSKWWPKIAQGGGLIAVCLQTDNLQQEIAAFRNAGVKMGDPKPLSRVRPDGYHLSWVLSLHEGTPADVVPFLIEDETPRSERVPKETAHRNGVVGVGTVTVAVSDLATIRSWYSSVLKQDGRPIERKDLEAAGIRFVIGPHTFDFVAPVGTSGAIPDWLRKRGPSPYSLTLKTAAGTIFNPSIASTN